MTVKNLFGGSVPVANLLGEIVSWGVPSGTTVAFGAVKAALAAAGLDDKVARDMLPRHALSRAVWSLSERRIVRKVGESAADLRMQFTAEVRDADADRLRYDFEAVLVLDKVTGKVRCDQSPELADKAQKLIDHESGVRTVADLNRMIQRLFELNADLFPVRDAGGCYFVPAEFKDFIGQIETFVSLAGGNIRRFPVPAGTGYGDRSVAESVGDGLDRIIGQHVRAVEEFDDSVRDGTLEKMVERINTTRFKAEAYAEYLGDKKAEVEDALAAARAALRQKIADLGRAVPVPEPLTPEAAAEELLKTV